MDPKEAVIKAMELHDEAGRELLTGRLHRAKAYILDALRTLREAAEANRDRMYGLDEFMQQLDGLYQELYVVDPRSASAEELDRYRWRLHRLVEDFAFKTLDTVEGIVEIPVDGWVDRKAAEFAREFVRAKKMLEDSGLIISADRGTRAYVIGNVAYVKVGSSPDHAASLRYDSRAGGYVLRYYDTDVGVVNLFIKLISDIGGRVLERTKRYVDVLVPENVLSKAARALALMPSEDMRQHVVEKWFMLTFHPDLWPTIPFLDDYRRFVETGEVRCILNAPIGCLLLTDGRRFAEEYLAVRRALKEYEAARQRGLASSEDWENVRTRTAQFLSWVEEIYRNYLLDDEAAEKVREFIFSLDKYTVPEILRRLGEFVAPVLKRLISTDIMLESVKGELQRYYNPPYKIRAPDKLPVSYKRKQRMLTAA
jgi:hypothetical protein